VAWEGLDILKNPTLQTNVFQELPCGLQQDRRKTYIYVVIGWLIEYSHFISIGVVGIIKVPRPMEIYTHRKGDMGTRRPIYSTKPNTTFGEK
jgi:hypothetical protein